MQHVLKSTYSSHQHKISFLLHTHLLLFCRSDHLMDAGPDLLLFSGQAAAPRALAPLHFLASATSSRKRCMWPFGTHFWGDERIESCSFTSLMHITVLRKTETLVGLWDGAVVTGLDTTVYKNWRRESRVSYTTATLSWLECIYIGKIHTFFMLGIITLFT